MEAVEDLSGLATLGAMSASLKNSAYFYYYGDRIEKGRRDQGIAVCREDQYYYGEWKDGFRSG